ncbi:Nitrogen regulatory protein NtrP [Beijerinckiaceae bacterium RH AL1]|jgi:antitoxin VapB|nr:hypothetical protein [Beijerinckiaceae bacterium]VVB48805.1 Nitrogen regulatory protein NtrP [Beijerinckiaceae bacterium RH CH11]VVB48884.1 Nitrogen regulatory protein NtrP [Beijerinckiaceae bacterium RH AL8]VVC56577.1 Nitrogen regulatory protein NtrP [Beijerinckiaceae bacterium RH AL1]
MPDTATASIELEGERQVVRLPEGFRLPGHEVRIRRSGDGLMLEPIKPQPSRQEIEAILARLKRAAAEDGPFMPEGREQPPMPDDDEPNPFDALP